MRTAEDYEREIAALRHEVRRLTAINDELHAILRQKWQKEERERFMAFLRERRQEKS